MRELPIAGDADAALAAAFPTDWQEYPDHIESVGHGELTFKEWLESVNFKVTLVE